MNMIYVMQQTEGNIMNLSELKSHENGDMAI